MTNIVELFPDNEPVEHIIVIRAIALVPKRETLHMKEICFVTAANMAQELARIGCIGVLTDTEVSEAVM